MLHAIQISRYVLFKINKPSETINLFMIRRLYSRELPEFVRTTKAVHRIFTATVGRPF